MALKRLTVGKINISIFHTFINFLQTLQFTTIVKNRKKNLSKLISRRTYMMRRQLIPTTTTLLGFF